MGTTRELVTFQLGHYANFIGTHWWNIQESSFVYDPTEQRYPKELNHDVLFREGVNVLGQVTYTPRLISLDLKGSLNTLKQEGTLYNVDSLEEDLQWSGDVTMHKLDAGQKNDFLKDLEEDDVDDEDHIIEKDDEKDENIEESGDIKSIKTKEEDIFGPKFYDLDDKVNVWSDFLRLHLHPKSVAVIEQYRHGWENEPFDVFGYGQEIYKHYDTRQGIEDRMHFFLEDCDSLQGLHLLVDTQDGFGGLASSIIEELNDDYGNKSVLVYSVSPPSFSSDTISKECHRTVNSLLSYNELLPYSSMIVPISLASNLWRSVGPVRQFPHLNYKSDLLYHTSAILAASLDTMTIPYRLESNSTLMPHFTDGLTTCGRKMLSLQTTLPIPLRKDQKFVDYLQQLGDSSPWQTLTPACCNNAKPSQQSVVVRGIPQTQIKEAPDQSQPHLLNNCKTIADVMQLYLTDVFSTKLNVINSIVQPVATATPYPHIFDKNISNSGHLDEHKERMPKLGVSEVPVMTSLQCGPDVKNHLDSLYKVCKKFNIAKFHRFRDSGLEDDTYKETLENIRHFMECYEEKSAYDSDSDDDDDSDESSDGGHKED